LDTIGTEKVGEEDRDREEGAEEERAIWLEKQEIPPAKKFSMQKEHTI